MKYLKISVLVSLVFLASCAIRKMKALSNCEFKLNKVKNINVAGVAINAEGKTNIGLSEGMKILAAYGNKSLPVNLSLGILGSNPNSVEALMAKFDWKIKIKGEEVVNGTTNNNVRIGAESSEVFDFSTKFDLYNALSSYSLEELKDFTSNVFDSDGNPKDLKFYIKPYLTIGKVNIPYPGFIEITKHLKSK